MTRALLFSLCCFAVLAVTRQSASADQELRIGSQAPALDIEHWIQDGNGYFKPVKKFKKDNVYVVEFWATWCGPCIMSMPHLAELQTKYRGSDVQIISVSDESVDEVEDLLSQKNNELGKTFGEITSAYSLTTDPDRSVHKDYMEAANQDGIPTSFIVGKSGLIEWIGHPMGLDEPLAAVVDDSWDREAFKKEYQAKADFELAMQKLSRLAGAGKFEDAIKLVDKELAKTDSEPLKIQWTDIRYSLKMSAGQIDDDLIAYYRDHIETIKDDPISLARFGYSLYGMYQEGAKIAVLATDVASALQASKEKAPEEATPYIYNTLAQMYVVEGKLDDAIEAQEQAVETADTRQKKRLMPFLEELREQADVNHDDTEEEDAEEEKK